MSVHVSRGLLPDAERPHCRYHPKNKMRLVRSDQTINGTGWQQGEKEKWAGRKIYRCAVPGCNVVWCGPCEIYHTKRESTMETIQPWH